MRKFSVSKPPASRLFVALPALLAFLLGANPAIASPDVPAVEEVTASAAPQPSDLNPGDGYMGASQNSRGKDPSRAQHLSLLSAPPAAGVQGVDVASHQGEVDWERLHRQGKRFAYVKATEGVEYTNDEYFQQQYYGARAQEMFTGAYHFALPHVSSGREQADYFIDNGGGWTPDGATLPGVLDLEEPYFDTEMNYCWDMTPTQLRSWIDDFLTRYQQRTGRSAGIYTAAWWWNDCVIGSTAFSAEAPLWVPRYNTSVGPLPKGWPAYTFWQYTDQYGMSNPIDQNIFQGTLAQLQQFAMCPALHPVIPPTSITDRAYTSIDLPLPCDIPLDHVFSTEISWLLKEGITTGYDDGTFRPRSKISREAMAAFLYRFSGSPRVDGRKTQFSDVPPSHPFYTEITWLANSGITTGYNDGTFQPSKKITREAMAAFLYRYAGTPPVTGGAGTFSDIAPDHAFGQEISWLTTAGITTGYEDGTFRPRNNISREATAAFLHRFDEAGGM